MTPKEPVAERNLDGYGAPMIPWSRVRERVDEGFTQGPGTGGPDRHTAWLATVDPNGAPHVVAVGVMWVDGAFYFTTGPNTRKGKNLARNPSCAITIATDPFDLVAEGTAEKVTDDAKLQRMPACTRPEGGRRPCATARSTQSSAHRAPALPPGTCTG